MCVAVRLSHLQQSTFMNFLSDLHAGRAGEHLAAADLLCHGHECFASAQGMPYDLVADIGGDLLRVQVKATVKPKDVPARNVNSYLYQFFVSRCGKGGVKSYSTLDVDLFAIVALDTRQVGYIAASKMPTTLFVRPDARRGSFQDELQAKNNALVLSDLDGGMSVRDAAAKHGATENWVRKVRLGAVKSHVAGVYFSDLTLETALAAMNDNNGRKLAGRKPKSAVV